MTDSLDSPTSDCFAVGDGISYAVPKEPDTRWLVETKPNEFDDVGAASLVVGFGGTLEFFNSQGKPVLGYAPGQWITYAENEAV